jgi:hypothetical protein
VKFDPEQYGPQVAQVLALSGNGERLFPLEYHECISPEARDLLKQHKPADLFPGVEEPEAPMAGLYLYLSCFEEAHELAQYCESAEGELWHAILHRQEPDAGNAAYWFRKAGPHPTFSQIAVEAVKILKRYPLAEFRTGRWDPFAFVQFCERARGQRGSVQEQAAMEIQRAEWQILFDYCAKAPA